MNMHVGKAGFEPRTMGFQAEHLTAVELALWESGLLHFSTRSRDQLKGHVLI
jgi:hypothetical protein